MGTGAEASSAMEQTMVRLILKASACAAAAMAMYGCAGYPASQNNQGDSPTAAGMSDVNPPYYSPSTNPDRMAGRRGNSGDAVRSGS
jgi:hypothetical protein